MKIRILSLSGYSDPEIQKLVGTVCEADIQQGGGCFVNTRNLSNTPKVYLYTNEYEIIEDGNDIEGDKEQEKVSRHQLALESGIKIGESIRKLGIRKFGTGATRNTDQNKPDYEGFLSPLVIERYGEYMNKHRYQSDKKLRDSDNWQKGFGKEHFKVCMKSLWRHFLDLWTLHRGNKGRETIDEAICGILFNAMAYYHQLLLDRKQDNDN